jgi:ABC-type amino acid transport substrate-binding protein
LSEALIMKLGEKSWVVPAAVAVLLLTIGAASAGTLDRIGQEKAIRIAYREDAPPFSYKDKIGEAGGFMVDLCRAVATKIAAQRNLSDLKVVYVPVTAADRFEAITHQKTDLLCEPTTATLSRREQVDFSIPTFLDGAGLMVRADAPKKSARSGRPENRSFGRHDDRGVIAQLVEGRRRHRRCRHGKNPWRGSGDAGRGQDLCVFRRQVDPFVPGQGQQGTREIAALR